MQRVCARLLRTQDLLVGHLHHLVDGEAFIAVVLARDEPAAWDLAVVVRGDGGLVELVAVSLESWPNPRAEDALLQRRAVHLVVRGLHQGRQVEGAQGDAESRFLRRGFADNCKVLDVHLGDVLDVGRHRLDPGIHQLGLPRRRAGAEAWARVRHDQGARLVGCGSSARARVRGMGSDISPCW